MAKIISFTTILHEKRKQLGLSLMEYCIADTIHNLSNNPKSPVQGWCYASKDTLAEMLDTTRQTIFTSVKKLIEKGLIKKHEETKYLRTTQKWFNKIIVEDDEMEEEIEKEKEEPEKELKAKIIKYSKDDVEMTELLLGLVKQNYPFVKDKTETQLLRDFEEMNKLHRIDNWEYKQIRYVIEFSQKDSFWKQNIRSVKTLRKQFESLVIKLKGIKERTDREVMFAREDGTAFKKDYGKWVPVDNPKNIVDMDYYKSVAEDNLMTKIEYEKKFAKQIA